MSFFHLVVLILKGSVQCERNAVKKRYESVDLAFSNQEAAANEGKKCPEPEL